MPRSTTNKKFWIKPTRSLGNVQIYLRAPLLGFQKEVSFKKKKQCMVPPNHKNQFSKSWNKDPLWWVFFTVRGPTDTWRPAIGAFFRMQTRQQGFATARMSSECFSEKRGSISEMIRLSREADSDSLCPVNPSAILRLASLVTLAACGLSVVAEEDGKQERALRDTCLSRTVSSVAWLRDVA